MALAHAILVSLLDRPQSGYEIGKRFDRTVGFFWKASHQQIYQELHKLAKAGLVRGETVEQTERPNRIVYELTDCGRDALDSWSRRATDPPSVKEELIVKLFALGDVDDGVIRGELERRRDFHRDRLAYYESVMAAHYPDPARLRPRQQGRYLGLRMGIVTEQATLAWCDEALGLLAGAPAGG